jgi:hypothetical protein
MPTPTVDERFNLDPPGDPPLIHVAYVLIFPLSVSVRTCYKQMSITGYIRYLYAQCTPSALQMRLQQQHKNTLVHGFKLIPFTHNSWDYDKKPLRLE